MRIFTTALVLAASASFAQAGEIVATTSQQASTRPAVQVQPAEQAAVKAAPQSAPKPSALGKVGREGCGDGAQAKAPLLTN